MKKIFSIFSKLLLLIIVAVGCIAVYISFVLPKANKPENLKINLTKDRIERGRYIANHVALCVDCHSTRDWSKFSAPLVLGTEGKGGEIFNQDMGFPGVFYSANITPAKLSNWTDGELFRLITTGVNKKGKAIFPVMPYLNYGKLDREDIYDIIAYIRSLPAIENEVKSSKADFPMNLIINTMPEHAQLSKKPQSSDTIAYGKYLVTMAACGDCHTPFEKGSYDESKRLAGGRMFPLPSGNIYSANITPDASGIGSWSREQFISRFKMYADSSYKPVSVNMANEFNTIMPWSMYAGMKESDLASIYAYLKSLQPISNSVVKFIKK
jgi:cytochrome c553